MKFKKGVLKIFNNILQPKKKDGLTASEVESIIPLLKDKKVTQDLINFFTKFRQIPKNHQLFSTNTNCRVFK